MESTTCKALRRSFDVAVAITGLLVAVPFIALAAALSFAHYRAWPFFVQDRVGLDGSTFRFLKVRTLSPVTDRYADKFSIRVHHIPRAMDLLRRSHLDELPQLVHVLTGRMTLVGPRPEMPTLHAEMPPSFATLRTSVRPGMTGLWQVSVHSQRLIGERPEYDRLYVEHRNVRLDVWILAQTVRKVVRGRTAHLHEVPRWAFRSPAWTAPRRDTVSLAGTTAGLQLTD